MSHAHSPRTLESLSLDTLRCNRGLGSTCSTPPKNHWRIHQLTSHDLADASTLAFPIHTSDEKYLKLSSQTPENVTKKSCLRGNLEPEKDPKVPLYRGHQPTVNKVEKVEIVKENIYPTSLKYKYNILYFHNTPDTRTGTSSTYGSLSIVDTLINMVGRPAAHHQVGEPAGPLRLSVHRGVGAR